MLYRTIPRCNTAHREAASRIASLRFATQRTQGWDL